MKKKLLGIIFAIIMPGLTGCSDTTKLKLETSEPTYEIFAEDDRFMKIESINGWIYIDKETNVQYFSLREGMVPV